MKNIRYFEDFNYSDRKINEGFVATILVGFGLALASSGIYERAKKFWSKNVIGSKYKKTGRTEVLETILPDYISPMSFLSNRERREGKVVTLLEEYEDSMGNLYWGYDHLWSHGTYADREEIIANTDLYTAMYRGEDYDHLKRFIQDSTRYSGRGSRVGQPKVVDMIYREEVSK